MLKTLLEIVDAPGNVIVRASAGTGKTHAMVSKIDKEIKERSDHKVVAAITFTRKAAKEIRDRLTIDTSGHFIGTNNSFVIEEIIKPFLRDAYGEEFDFDMSADYSVKRSSFEECLSVLKNNQIICVYSKNDKNFVFELALKIVRKSKACRLFLRAKYFKIYVDEYQDCDYCMHDFFMYLGDKLGIDLFVVGDTKQSIFTWRGAYPDFFKEIWENNSFTRGALTVNYRSCQAIQNYSNLLYEETCDLYKAVKDVTPVTLVVTTQDKWGEAVAHHLDATKETALLRYRRDDAEKGAEELTGNIGRDFVYVPTSPIASIATNVYSFCNAIVQYCVLPRYSIYDFIDEMRDEFDGVIKSEKDFRERLNVIGEAAAYMDGEGLNDAIVNMASHFGYKISETDLKNTVETICEKKYHAVFYADELTHISSTFHSSKGLQFEQVIVFANDYSRLDRETDLDNHYVAVTRAKSKLLIVCLRDRECKKYCHNLQKIFSERGVALQDVVNIVRS